MDRTSKLPRLLSYQQELAGRSGVSGSCSQIRCVASDCRRHMFGVWNAIWSLDRRDGNLSYDTLRICQRYLEKSTSTIANRNSIHFAVDATVLYVRRRTKWKLSSVPIRSSHPRKSV